MAVQRPGAARTARPPARGGADLRLASQERVARIGRLGRLGRCLAREVTCRKMYIYDLCICLQVA